MRLLARLLTAALLFSPSFAVFADDAYHVDYHHALLGRPQQHATFFQQPYPGSKASLIYTLSAESVLGAVNPKDGTLIWRQSLSPTTSNVTDSFLRAGEGQDIVVSAAGDQVAAWRASDGRLAWRNTFGGAAIRALEVLELEDGSADAAAKDAIVLFDSPLPTVRRLDGKTGKAKWAFEDASGDSPFQVSTSATTVYLISLHSALLGGSKIKVTSLSPVNGRKLDQYTLSSETDVASPESILLAGANSASPLLAWTDEARRVLKINIIGTKTTASLDITSGNGEDVEEVIVHAPHRINSVPHFLVHVRTSKHHWAEVFHIDLKTSSIVKAYDLPKLAGQGVFTTSASDANVYFTRITLDEVTVFSSASHGILGRWPVKSLAGPGVRGPVYPLHGISEVVARSGSAHAIRSAVVLSSGDWILVRNGETSWARPEYLAEAVTATWADLPEEETLAQELEIEVHENILAAYVHRVKRHVRDLKHLPSWLESIPNRILASFSGKKTVLTNDLKPDSFGFHKFVIVATSTGRLAALSAGGAGRVVWNIELPQPATGTAWTAPQLEVLSRGVVRVADANLGLHISVAVETGIVLPEEEPKSQATPPADLKPRPIVYKRFGDEIRGFQSDAVPSSPLWTFSPPEGERILDVTPLPVDEPVASIGKVLGDRSVLYKYLNPNLVLVTTVVDGTSQASIYLVDSTSGQTLYSSSHNNVDISQTIASAISENWFAYSFSVNGSASPSTKGHELVVGELYESSIPNDRGPLGQSTNFSGIQPSSAYGDPAKPYILLQSYIIPEPISGMTVSRTRQGITSRLLLVTLPESGSIVGIPRSVIDPRRPVGRDPTPAETSEGLTTHAPVINFDPSWYLNHVRDVIGIKRVVSSPALLESTSLVFGYGLDVFGTRVSPSYSFDMLGKGFNKLQMLGTVAALAAGVLFVAPLVRRKQINMQWQVS